MLAEKTAARNAAAIRRKQAYSVERQTSAVHRLVDWIIRHNLSSPIAGYLAIGSEIDPIDAMLALYHTHSCQICVPVIDNKTSPLKFRTWTPEAKLKSGPFRVEVPISGNWLSPKTIIVPLLAFDRHGHRLGYGGGFYDRTLRQLRHTNTVSTIGIAFAAQETELLPVSKYDQMLDFIVTEKEVISNSLPDEVSS